jgi:anti-anti-sigma regulatory factor
MCSIEVKDTDIGRVVRLGGKLVIDHASELRDAFMKAFEGSQGLNLDMSRVESTDLACLQVLCAAHRLSVRLGKKIAVSTPASPGFLKSMKDMAVHPAICNSPFDKECLWRQE